MARNKYTYPTRLAAEEAAANAHRAEIHALVALDAALSGDAIAWPAAIGPYRVRMVARRFSVLLIIRQPRANGAGARVYDAEEFARRYDGPDGEYNPEARRIGYHARRIVAAYYKTERDATRENKARLADAIREELAE